MATADSDEFEALFRAAFDDSDIPSWITDLETTSFLAVNASASTKYGYQTETFLNSDLRLLRPNDDVRALAADYREFVRAGGLHKRRHRRADGEWLSIEVSVRPVEFKGRPAALAQILDATSLSTVQDQIARAYDRVTKILDCALDAVVSIDRQSNIIEWAGEATNIFGWDADEALGQKMHELIMPERYRSAHLEGLASYYVTGNAKLLGKIIQIHAIRRSGEEFPIDIRITRVDRISSFDFTAFIRDRTELAAARQSDNA